MGTLYQHGVSAQVLGSGLQHTQALIRKAPFKTPEFRGLGGNFVPAKVREFMHMTVGKDMSRSHIRGS